MDSIRQAIGDAFSLLYISSPLLTVAMMGLLGLLGVVALIVAVVAGLRRQRRLALAASAVVSLMALPAAFFVGWANTLAWPGRFAPVVAADVVGRYSVDEVDICVILRPDGSYNVAGAAWTPTARAGTWRVVPLEGWHTAGQAGHVVLGSGGGDERWLLLARPPALLLSAIELSPTAFATLQRQQQREQGFVGGNQRLPLSGSAAEVCPATGVEVKADGGS